MRQPLDEICGCFPTGRNYPGIADLLRELTTRVPGLCAEFDAAASWVDLPMVIIDFETTGLDADRDRVLEIGLVCLDGQKQTIIKQWLVNPGIPVPEEARKVHGITDEELRDAPDFAAVFAELAPLLRGRVPVAYNAGFDLKFLHAEIKRLGQPEVQDVPAFRRDVVWLDPLVWVRELQKYERGKKLTDVCARMSIRLDNAHRAAGDAFATSEVLLRLAAQMPQSYGDTVRQQAQLQRQQDAEMASWRSRKGN